MRKKALLLAVFFLALVSTKAQQVISSSGGSFKPTTTSISWTVGEPVVGTLSNGTNSLTQGVQQSFLTVTSLAELETLSFQILAYPNPTNDYVFIQFKELSEPISMDIKLYDLNGKVLLSKRTFDESIELPMKDFEPAIYLLKIISDNKELKTFKIIKK